MRAGRAAGRRRGASGHGGADGGHRGRLQRRGTRAMGWDGVRWAALGMQTLARTPALRIPPQQRLAPSYGRPGTEAAQRVKWENQLRRHQRPVPLSRRAGRAISRGSTPVLDRDALLPYCPYSTAAASLPPSARCPLHPCAFYSVPYISCLGGPPRAVIIVLVPDAGNPTALVLHMH